MDSRDKTLRRFQAFTGDYPWRWSPADIEERSVSLGSAGRSHTTGHVLPAVAPLPVK